MGQHTDNATGLISDYSPMLANIWATRPLHRSTVIATLFQQMKEVGDENAYRVRILLNRYLEAQRDIRAIHAGGES